MERSKQVRHLRGSHLMSMVRKQQFQLYQKYQVGGDGKIDIGDVPADYAISGHIFTGLPANGPFLTFA